MRRVALCAVHFDQGLKPLGTPQPAESPHRRVRGLFACGHDPLCVDYLRADTTDSD